MIDLEEKRQRSKSQIKRDMLALQDLGRELVDLSSKALHQLSISDEIREAVLEAKHLKMEALRRQLKHIGKLMRDEDADAISMALATLRKPHEEEVKVFHEVEGWRDALLAGDDALLNESCKRFADMDRQHLRQLLRNAKREQALDKAPKSARALFRYLKELLGLDGGERD
jgi:ribosome-associated protein